MAKRNKSKNKQERVHGVGSERSSFAKDVKDKFIAELAVRSRTGCVMKKTVLPFLLREVKIKWTSLCLGLRLRLGLGFRICFCLGLGLGLGLGLWFLHLNI